MTAGRIDGRARAISVSSGESDDASRSGTPPPTTTAQCTATLQPLSFVARQVLQDETAEEFVAQFSSTPKVQARAATSKAEFMPRSDVQRTLLHQVKEAREAGTVAGADLLGNQPARVLSAAREFVPADAAALLLFLTSKLNFAVSFRKTGLDSIPLIEAGAACKPHTILEKTVKQDSLIKKYGEAEGIRIYDVLKANGLNGMVGHWQAHGLAGVHVVPPPTHEVHKHPQFNELALSLAPIPGTDNFYLPFDAADERDVARAAQALKSASPENFVELCMTGDLDMHDLQTHRSGRYCPVPSHSHDEKYLVNVMNGAFQQGRTFQAPRQRWIQHGAQDSFIAHMRDKERGAPMPLAVMNPSFPILLFEKGAMHLVENESQYKDVCHTKGLTQKFTWQPNAPGLSIQAIGDSGMGKLRWGQTSNRF